MRPTAPSRSAFRYFLSMQTRWKDNDSYGHVNNVVSYEIMDTIVNKWLIDECDFGKSFPMIGYVVHSSCDYFSQLKYPQLLTAGLAVDVIGTSSVTYRIGLFAPDAELAASSGVFRHAYVDAGTKLPVRPLPELFRSRLEGLMPAVPAKL